MPLGTRALLADVIDLFGKEEDQDRFIKALGTGGFFRLKWIRIKIIDGCNIQCIMCNHWRREINRKLALSFERLISLGAELKELGCQYVRWSGGEPTLRRDLPQIIKHYTNLGIESAITTNGTLLDELYCQELCEAGLKSVNLSLESASSTIHNKVVGNPNAWKKLVKGILNFRKFSGTIPSLSFQTVLTKVNMGPELLGIVPLAYRLGVSRVRFQPVVVSHIKNDKDILPSRDQIQKFTKFFLPRIYDMGKEKGISVTVDSNDFENEFELSNPPLLQIENKHLSASGFHSGEYYNSRICYLPWYHCTLDFRGRVFGCCHMREDEGKIGDINESSLVEVLHSTRAKELRQLLLTSQVPFSCKTCTMQIRENQVIDWVLGKSPSLH